ncbi:MAG: phage terminase large subunit family protein [Candidatus Competibacteraceae bacterium]|nr:phage terminase large subunit family protein [Candidatus Competibacteraceae bacterium]
MTLKDAVAADLERGESGPGYIHFPAWLAAWFFDELTAETRTAKGWENMGGARNEAFDLMVYNSAAMLALGGDKIISGNRPGWANPELAAIPIESTPPEAKQVVKKEHRTAVPVAGGSFINRPSGEPWIRR